MTHRCHNQEFLLKFVRDRNAYRAKLLAHLKVYDVSLLDYCVTSNHVHLLFDAPEREELSGLVQRQGPRMNQIAHPMTANAPMPGSGTA